MDNDVCIRQGAEAKIYTTTWQGLPAIRKERLVKLWRHPLLDSKLRRSRLKQESRCLQKAFESGLPVPRVLAVDTTACHLTLEYIQGLTLKDHLQSSQSVPTPTDRLALWTLLGHLLNKLHGLDIIHEDLTTSNIMVRSKTAIESSVELVLIDFGLSHTSLSLEDKAVDLYVLERSFCSSHPGLAVEFSHILEAYGSEGSTEEETKKSARVLSKLADVRARGRKRTLVG